MNYKNQLLVLGGIATAVTVIHRHIQFKTINDLKVRVGDTVSTGKNTIGIQNFLLVSGLIGASTLLFYGLKK